VPREEVFALVNRMYWSIKYNQDLWQNSSQADVTPRWQPGVGWNGTVWLRGPISPSDRRGKLGSEEPGQPWLKRVNSKRTDQLGRVELVCEEENLSLFMKCSQIFCKSCHLPALQSVWMPIFSWPSTAD